MSHPAALLCSVIDNWHLEHATAAAADVQGALCDCDRCPRTHMMHVTQLRFHDLHKPSGSRLLEGMSFGANMAVIAGRGMPTSGATVGSRGRCFTFKSRGVHDPSSSANPNQESQHCCGEDTGGRSTNRSEHVPAQNNRISVPLSLKEA